MLKNHFLNKKLLIGLIFANWGMSFNSLFAAIQVILPQPVVVQQEDPDAKKAKCKSEILPQVRVFGKSFLGQILPQKWAVNQASWHQKMNQPCVYQEDVIRDQFQTDVVLWWQAMFQKAQAVGGKKLEPKHLDKLQKTQNFLKRWIITMAFAPMTYVTKDNASAKNPNDPAFQNPQVFPFPLSSALSHGQRILVELHDVPNGKGMDQHMHNILFTGNMMMKPNFDELRSFASHGVHQDPNGKLLEDKLVMGFMGAIQGDHHMINIPLGGVGNINELGFIIGPEGQSYASPMDAVNYSKFGIKSVVKYQLGHVFIGVHRFNNGISSLLMGVESTAPHMSSPFLIGGKTHTAASGMQDATTNRSSTGGQKWANLLGSLAPATYGGMVIIITRPMMAKLEQIINLILSMPEQQQEIIFKELLSMNALEGIII